MCTMRSRALLLASVVWASAAAEDQPDRVTVHMKLTGVNYSLLADSQSLLTSVQTATHDAIAAATDAAQVHVNIHSAAGSAAIEADVFPPNGTSPSEVLTTLFDLGSSFAESLGRAVREIVGGRAWVFDVRLAAWTSGQVNLEARMGDNTRCTRCPLSQVQGASRCVKNHCSGLPVRELQSCIDQHCQADAAMTELRGSGCRGAIECLTNRLGQCSQTDLLSAPVIELAMSSCVGDCADFGDCSDQFILPQLIRAPQGSSNVTVQIFLAGMDIDRLIQNRHLQTSLQEGVRDEIAAFAGVGNETVQFPRVSKDFLGDVVVATDLILPDNARASLVHTKLQASLKSSAGIGSLTRVVRNIGGIDSVAHGGDTGGGIIVRDIVFTVALHFGGHPVNLTEADLSSRSGILNGIVFATSVWIAALPGLA